MKETSYKGEDMKCPICDQVVKKVTESDRDVAVPIKCDNEYGVHYGNYYIKFITPRTSPDEVRFKLY